LLHISSPQVRRTESSERVLDGQRYITILSHALRKQCENPTNVL